MIVAINYSDDKYKISQKFNSKMALKFGADKVIEYGPDSLSKEFKEKNKDILSAKRGGGYWLWKPYILLDTLNKTDEGNYVVYTDSGSAFVQPISMLIDSMNKECVDIMSFSTNQVERKWSKRDALILMNCDKPEYLDSAQICGGYIIVKKNQKTVHIIKKYLEYAQDRRIISDDDNVLGMDNYSGFIENRHDQTIWSLLCKKNNIYPFRDPSEWGLDKSLFDKSVIARSEYPQIIESHRCCNMRYEWQLKYNRERNWKSKIIWWLLHVIIRAHR